MNKSQNTQDLGGIFVPLIEELSTSIGRGIEWGATGFNEFIKNGFKFKEKENVYHRLNTRMLLNGTRAEEEKYLGYSVNYERPYALDKIDPTKHVFLIGASGWGKTNLINILMENAMRRNQAVIFIDPKGTREAISDFKKLSHYYNKNMAIFSEFDEMAQSFNPIADMTNTQRIQLIMRSFDWGKTPNEYFLNESTKALGEALSSLTSSSGKVEIDLHDLFLELKTKHSRTETSGLLTQFQILLNSDFGKLFKRSSVPGKQCMTLKKAWKEKTCVYIGCSTQGYSKIARTVGKMFVSEAMNLSYWIGREHEDSHVAMANSIGLFIDEVGSVLFPDFLDLVNKCRSSGINIYTAAQSYSDIEMIGGGETLMKQLFESYSTWLFQRQTNPDNAEKLASAFGTYLSQKVTSATEKGTDSGRGSIREAYEYFCHPDIFKSINVGQTILLTHSPKDIAIINVRDFRKSKVYQSKLPASTIEQREKEAIKRHGILGDKI